MIKNQIVPLFLNKKIWVIASVGCIIFYVACTSSSSKKSFSATAPTISFSSTVPKDIPNPADPQQAAQFAWQEFVALTWPAKANPSPSPGNSPYFRGQASTTDSLGSTGSGGVVVWETFYHRDELYPGYASGAGNVLPNPDTIPNYIYPSYVSITPAMGVNQHLFNNLDEASEITLANMYYTPLAQKVD